MRYLILLITLTACYPTPMPTTRVFVGPPSPTTPVEMPLERFAEFAIEVCKAKISETRRILLAKQISRIAEETFMERRHAEAFFSLICAESAYSDGAKSSVGAVGLTQVMPQHAAEFADKCGFGKLAAEDLHDSEVNLRIGACVFNGLIGKFGGNVALAQSAYNSGPSSDTTKSLARLGGGNSETTGYIARQAVFNEMMRAKMKEAN